MDRRTADAFVYPALVVSTSVYAAALDYNKRHAPPGRKIEPDLTFVEVIAGDLMCLIAAHIRARLGPNTRAESMRATWLSFFIGGTPIVAWQLWRIYLRHKQREDTLQQHIEEWNGNFEQSPATLAALRPPSTRANGRNS